MIYWYLSLLLVFFSGQAYAVCSSPSGVAGELTWISAESKVKYCDGTDWKDTTQSAGASCSGTTAGTINYSAGEMRYCDGSNWQSMKGTVGASCSGTTAGTMEYTGGAYRFCDSTNWYDMTAVPAGKTAFVTSTTYTGSQVGSVSNANSICGTRASAASLTGTYKAWITSTASNSPSNTFTQSTDPYNMPNGTKIADDWTDLVSGSLDANFNIDEFGNAVSGATRVWTNTRADGTIYGESLRDCVDWTSNNSGDGGQYGVTTSTFWIGSAYTGCDNSYRLFCFEQ